MSILLKWGKWSCPRVKSVPVSTACYSSEGHCSWQSCLLSAAAMSSHKHCGECGKETLHPNRYPACQSIDATPLSTGVSRWISVFNSLWIPLNSWRPRSFAPFKSLFWPKLTTLSPERYSFIHPFIHSFIFFSPHHPFIMRGYLKNPLRWAISPLLFTITGVISCQHVPNTPKMKRWDGFELHLPFPVH